MALTLPSGSVFTAPSATACVGYPQLFRARFETNKANIGALTGALVFVSFGQCVGGVPMPQFRLTTGNNGSGPVFGAVRQPAWQYTILGTESVGATAFTGAVYQMAWGYSTNPTVEEQVRQAMATIQFFDAGAGPVYFEITVYWLNQRDIDPNQFTENQPNAKKLIRPSLASSTDFNFAGQSQFNAAGRRYAIQLAVFETLPADATHCAELTVYSSAAARWYNGATPTALLPDSITLVDQRLTNPDGTVEVLNTQATTVIEFDIDAAVLPTAYYAGILRTDAEDNSQFYAAGQFLMMMYRPTGGPVAPLPVQYEIDAGSFATSNGMAAPTTVSGTTRRVRFEIDGTMLRIGGTYMPFVLVQDAASTSNWYAFYYPPTLAVACPLLASPELLSSGLATRFAGYGSNIIAAARQFIRSTVTLTGATPSTYNSLRTIPFGNAVQAVALVAYYDETVGGDTFRHTIYTAEIARTGGTWPTGGAIQVASTADLVAVACTIYLSDAPVRCLGTINLTTGLQVLPATGNLDLRGKVVKLTWTLVALQSTDTPPFDEKVIVEQSITVKNDDIVIDLVLTDPLTGLDALVVCESDPPLDACFLSDVGPDRPYNLIIGPQSGAAGQAHFYSSEPATDLPMLTTPKLVDWPEVTDADGDICGKIVTSLLPLNTPQKLCIVGYSPEPFCYGLDFLGGPDGDPAEHVITTPTALLSFGTGPFAVSAWIYTDAGPFDGGAAVSRRPQGGTDETGWVLGPVGDKLQVFLSNIPLGGTTGTFVGGIVPGWNHVVVDFAGVDASTWTVYINGAAQAPEPGFPQTSGVVTSFDPAEILPPLGLGIDTPINTEDYFNGRLANVAIFGQAVSAAEALDLYNDGICGDPTALGLANVVWYPLREVSGTTAPEPVNGITGTLTNYSPARTATGGGAWQPI
jgi:hypothetical protein